MQIRHTDRVKYFNEQVFTTKNHVIPFVGADFIPGPGMNVLEVGCGEGGNLVPFLEAGCRVTGVDLSEKKIANAREFLNACRDSGQLTLTAMDIYHADDKLGGPFDLIMMRDVIEHIHEQYRFMEFIKSFLAESGCFFLAFPPWYNPFGGHQQICASKVISHFPYFHLLPAGIYRRILKWAGEPAERIRNLLEVRQTGISVERFRKIARAAGFDMARERLYLVNPNYEVKFGLKPRRLPGILSLPFLRNFLTTSVYVVLIKKNRR